jgi:hypothetical protein
MRIIYIVVKNGPVNVRKELEQEIPGHKITSSLTKKPTNIFNYLTGKKEAVAIIIY